MPMNKFHILSILCFILWTSTPLFAQLDTEFWFAVPEVCKHNGAHDRPISLIISSANEAIVHVEVSIPANPEFTPIEEYIQPNSKVDIDLTPYIDLLENRPEDYSENHAAMDYNQVFNKGLYIKTSQEVSVSYFIKTGNFYNTEYYALKGHNALGEEFYIPGQNEVDNTNDGYKHPKPINKFDIVATEDNTMVMIYPRETGIMQQHTDKDLTHPFFVNLNKGETYCCVAVDNKASHHLYGSYVKATNPIAITVTDDMLDYNWSGEDVTGDQIVPVNLLGTEFVAVKGEMESDRERVYIVPTEDNTSIYINGSKNPDQTIDKGRIGVIPFSQYSGSSAMSFTTDKPVVVWQLTGFGREFGAAILPQVQCTGSKSFMYTRTDLSKGSNKLKINVTIEKSAIDNFEVKVNGTLKNDILKGSDFSPVPGKSNWMFASKVISTSACPVNATLTISNEANFHIGVFEGGSSGGCSYGFFTDFGTAFELNGMSNHLENNNEFCEGDSLILSLKAGENMGSVHWEGPNGFYAEQASIVVTSNLKKQHQGKYIIYGDADYGCEVHPDTIEVKVFPPDHVTVYDTICNGNTYDFNGRQLSEGGTYYDTLVNRHGCDSMVTLILKVYYIDMDLGPELKYCADDFESATLDAGQDYFSYEWTDQTGQVLSTSRQVVVHEGGTYHLKARDEFGCMVEGDKIVSVIPNPEVHIELSPSEEGFCESKQGTLSANADADEYEWNTGETTSTITITKPGAYTVMVTKDNCSSVDTIALQCPCEITIPNVFTPNNDGVNDLFQPEFVSFFENYSMKVFDRWGKRVFFTESQEEFWDGTINGQKASDGVYYWVVTYSCNMTPWEIEERHGSVTLIR